MPVWDGGKSTGSLRIGQGHLQNGPAEPGEMAVSPRKTAPKIFLVEDWTATRRSSRVYADENDTHQGNER